MLTLWGQQLWGTSLWWGSEEPPPAVFDVLSIDLAVINPEWQDSLTIIPFWVDSLTVDSQDLDQKALRIDWVDSVELPVDWSDEIATLSLWTDTDIIQVGSDTVNLNALWLDTESVNASFLNAGQRLTDWLDVESLNPEWLDAATLQLVRYGMTALNNNLRPIVRGDTRKIQRTFTGLPSGETITKAWLTVKTSPSASDPGLFQVEITTTQTSTGQITDATSTDGQIGMYFIISGTNSALATGGAEYLYDIQVKTSNNTIHTLVMGTVTFYDGVTAASS